ncbi:MAG: 4Fe-4S cluster-binding domain-containing protein [Bacillota bacterium]
MRLGAIQTLATAETDSVSVNLFFQGCDIHCKGCHNPELWPLDGGLEVSVEEVTEKLKSWRVFHDALVLLGGEPLLQPEAVIALARAGKEMGYELWLFTGREYEEVPSAIRDIFDVIKCGPYIEELKTYSFPASTNQYVIDKRGIFNAGYLHL